MPPQKARGRNFCKITTIYPRRVPHGNSPLSDRAPRRTHLTLILSLVRVPTSDFSLLHSVVEREKTHNRKTIGVEKKDGSIDEREHAVLEYETHEQDER